MKKNMKQIIKYNNISKIDIEMTLKKITTLLDADITLLDSLSIACETSVNKNLKDMLSKIMDKIRSGDTVAKSILDVVYIKSNVIINLIELIDEIGDISGIVKKIIIYQDSRNKMMKSLIKSVTYPSMLLLAIMIFFFVSNTRIIPIFTEIYYTQGYELPHSLKVFILLGNIFKIIIFILISIFVVGLIFKCTSFGRQEEYRYKIHEMSLYSKLYRNLKLYYIFNNIYLLVSSGYQIDYAIDKIKNNEKNVVLSSSLDRVLSNVNLGLTISESFKKEKYLSGWYISMIEVSEQAGEIDNVFNHISIILKEDIKYSLEKLSIYVEPVLIVLLGVLVGVLVISLSTPLMNFDIYM